MSNIRLRFAGFAAFGVRLMSIFTGLAFSIMITRRLTEVDFGVWALIGLTVSYTLFPATITNYWLTRHIARGFKVAKTGLMMNAVFTTIATVAYLIISIPIAQSVDSPFTYFLIAGAYVPLFYSITTVEAVAMGIKPEVSSYGFLAFEVVKVIMGIWLIVYSRLDLMGAILAVAGAYFAQLILIAVMLRENLTGGFDGALAKRWLAVFWLPIYGALALTLLNFDGLIVSTMVGSPLPLTYYKVPSLISTTIWYSGYLAAALYPKLLGGGGREDVEASIRFVLMFGIPMSVGAFIMARPLLYLLNPNYADLLWILRALIPASLVYALTGIFDAVLTGTERVELRNELRFKDFAKSRLFLVPSIAYVTAAAYLIGLGILTYLSQVWSLDYRSLALAWALIWLIIISSSTFYKWMLARRVISFKLPLTSLSKYVVSSIPMAVLLQMTKFSLEYIPTFFVYVVSVLLMVGLGALAYFLVLYSIDQEFRQIAMRVLYRYLLRR